MNNVKSQRNFLILVGVSIILLSFVYGLTIGLKRSKSLAYAGVAYAGQLGGGGELDEAGRLSLLSELGFPTQVNITRLGKNAAVNGRPATIISFSTAILPERLLREQQQFWESSGFKVSTKSGANRGVLIGFDPVSGRKLSLSVWTLPPELRGLAFASEPVQGMFSLLEDEKQGVVSSNVPEVPVIPGGRGGAVFQAEESGIESYSSVYSNPGSLEENINYYRRELGARGWNEANGELNSGRFRTGHLIFRRAREEVVLLFSRKDDRETVVAVFRGPRMEVPKGVF